MIRELVGVFWIVAVCLGDEHDGKALKLNPETFKTTVAEKDLFVMFFAPWCGHCKVLAPTWQDLAEKYNDKGEVTIAQVDCTVETELCSANDVTGYPTLKYFRLGEATPERYRGARDLAGLEQFIMIMQALPKATEKKEEAPAAEAEGAPKEDVAEKKAAVTELTDENFDSKTAKGMFFIKFFAPWCGHCQNMAPAWEKLGESLEHDETITVAKVDCTQHSGVCQQNGVKGYPTLMWFKDGKMVEKYQGGRSLDAFKEYITQMTSTPTETSDEGRIPEPSADVVVELVTGNFENAIASGVTFVKFFAPWCGHCKILAPTWEELAKKYVGSANVKIAKIDCTKEESRGVCSQQGVSGYPTVNIYRDGKLITEYEGSRTLDDLVSFITKNSGSRDEL